MNSRLSADVMFFYQMETEAGTILPGRGGTWDQDTERAHWLPGPPQPAKGRGCVMMCRWEA